MTTLFKQKVRQARSLRPYLAELAALLGRPVAADELVDLEHTAELRAAQQKFRAQTTACSEVPFLERTGERFRSFVTRLHDANPSHVYVWTPRTVDCGTLRVQSLCDVKWDFEFSVNKGGILAFVTTDLKDSLLLDLSQSPTGAQIVKIETQGTHWVKSRFDAIIS